VAKVVTRWWVSNRTPSKDLITMSQDTEVPRGRRLKRAAGAVAAVAVLIVAQASAASASTARPPTATQTLSTGPYTWHVATSTGGSESTRDGATDQPAGTGALHGEFPIVGVDGTVQIRRWQWGAVTALSADTVTIVSDDGYVSDYLVDAGVRSAQHIDAVTVGEKVTVVGMIDAAP
jgi:hypothetical protein